MGLDWIASIDLLELSLDTDSDLIIGLGVGYVGFITVTGALVCFNWNSLSNAINCSHYAMIESFSSRLNIRLLSV